VDREGEYLKKISIIINGPGIEEVKSLYGQASDWVQNVLSNYDIDVKVVKAYKMEDLEPELDDAWIITGSAHSVYDDFAWINYIKKKLIEMNKLRKPVLGICFGHQLIADTFGGLVELNSKGWEVGSCKVEITDEGASNKLFSGLKTPLSVINPIKMLWYLYLRMLFLWQRMKWGSNPLFMMIVFMVSNFIQNLQRQ